VASSCNICVGVWRASTFFKQCVGHHKIVKCHLPWFCWKCPNVLFLVVRHVYIMIQRLELTEYFFFSFLLGFRTNMPMYKGVLSFFSFNLVFILLITIYFIYFIFFYWFFFFNFVPHHLVSFNFYIKFGPHSFNCCFFLFLIEFCFQFRFSTFDFNLFLCEFDHHSFYCYLFDFGFFFIIIFQFHLLTFIWLRILLR